MHKKKEEWNRVREEVRDVKLISDQWKVRAYVARGAAGIILDQMTRRHGRANLPDDIPRDLVEDLVDDRVLRPSEILKIAFGFIFFYPAVRFWFGVMISDNPLAIFSDPYYIVMGLIATLIPVMYVTVFIIQLKKRMKESSF